MSSAHCLEDGALDGQPAPVEPRPFREFFRELAAVIPPFTLWRLSALARSRAERGGPALAAVLGKNLLAAVLVGGVATGLTRWLGNPAQWISLGIGVYAAVSWAQSLALRDRPSFTLIFTWSVSDPRRRHHPLPPEQVRPAILRFGLGAILYLVAVAAAFVNPWATLVIVAAMAVYYLFEQADPVHDAA